ncbi:MMPL family transporter [Aliikangiella coralliicola]|uniref:MMPL family transporter n=1 Tax=Aliikangiella coralliicola TaxID=2592383 RepID=A0A545UEF3_9GAMM|nr:hypothetical protein [Aliikangiella coralliicola]TQV87856.1 hypothetical protein FLL46_10785 [Aliikangiella coralliicola]
MNNKFGLLAWCVGMALLVALASSLFRNGVNIESNILKLLPSSQQDPFSEQAFEQFSQQSMQRLVFLVANKSRVKAKKSAEQLVEKIKSLDDIQSASFGMSSSEQKVQGLFSYLYRHRLVSKNDEKLLNEKKFDDFSDRVIQQLYSPLSGSLAELIPKDPFLLSYRFTSSISNSERNLRLDEGFLIAKVNDVYYVLVTATLKRSAFSPEVQQKVLSAIGEVESDWHNASVGTKLLRTGAVFFASHAQETARNEVSTIGVGSLILVIALVSLAFLSIKPLLLVTTTIFVGVCSGFVTVHYLFGSVHLLTIVFGASLIGVAVDYSFHYFSVEQGSETRSRLSKVFPAITLGLISSVIGYLSLLTTPFPGLQQMATFCISGLVAAYLTVVLLLPSIPLKSRIQGHVLLVCDKIINFAQSGVTKRIWLMTLLIPAVALVTFYSSPQESSDIRQFQNSSVELTQQQQAIQSILLTPAANQFYLVKGKTLEEMLESLENAVPALDRLVESGVIEGYQSISQWLPSLRRQQQVYQLYQRLYQSDALINLANTGIIEEKDIDKFRRDFAETKSQIISSENWLSSPLGKSLSYLWLGDINQQYAAIISIEGINQLEKLEDIDANVVFVDKVSRISELFQIYETRASWLLLVALVLIFTLLSFRYPVVKALLIISSPVIAIASALLGLFLFNIPLSLFNTLALFLVIGIGIDYGLFFAESREASANTLLAVVLSAMTTLFSFGLLALSETPAIHAFGVTMLFGIGTSLVLSPVIGSLVIKLGKHT